MTAIFPDSGVPPYEARNSILDPWTVNCSELWYSTARCEPRFDPAAANAMLSEMLNAVTCAGIPYDCSRLNNLCIAIQTMIRSGDSNCLYLQGGGFDYWGNLNPPLTSYPANCCMLLKVIPNIRNQGAVRISINGLGYIPVLRNDGTNLMAGDFLGGVPFLLVYCNGALWYPGLVSSQVPIVKLGGIDVWIRTDGNDTTGDGTENTAAKAYRTIMGAWYAVGSRYAATPLFSINMRLGIPGDYEGGSISNFGGGVSLTGDTNNAQAYRVMARQDPEHVYCIHMGNIGSYNLIGVHCVMNIGTQNAHMNNCFRAHNSNVNFYGNNYFSITVDVNCSCFLHMADKTSFGAGNEAHLYFNANNNRVSIGIMNYLGVFTYGTSGPWPPSHWHWANCRILNAGILAQDGCVIGPGNQIWWVAGCTGPKYSVNTNSILRMNGQPIPGDAPGYVGGQGQFWP
jgi:hypothetical protein